MQNTKIVQPNIAFLLPPVLTVVTYEYSKEHEHDYVLIRVRPCPDAIDGILVVAPLMRPDKDDTWKIWEVVIEKPNLSQDELDYLRQNNELPEETFARIWKSIVQDLTVRRVRQNLQTQAEAAMQNKNPDLRFLDFSQLLQKFYLQQALKANPIDWGTNSKITMQYHHTRKRNKK